MRILPLLVSCLWPAILLSAGPSVKPSIPRPIATPKAELVRPQKPTPGAKQTYKGGDGTRYFAGEVYKESGLPKVDRSQGAKQNFLRKNGLSKAPSGTEVDHITPLSKGGSDTPENMELLTREQHRKKTALERRK
jgi:5-methylcytosine-specific restriction endonuclease McrA